jgi:hypothetical protein
MVKERKPRKKGDHEDARMNALIGDGLPVAKARKNSSCKDCVSVLQNAPEESRVNARIVVIHLHA